MPLTPFVIAFYVLAGVFALFALIAGFGARRRWRERHRFSACHRGVWTGLWMLLALFSAFAASALLGYRRLTTETTLVVLQARELAPQRYSVRLEFPDGSRRSAEIQGDQWQLDARVIKWQPRAVMLGATPLYRLDRLSGRYADPDMAAATPPTLLDLGSDNPFDLFRLKQRFPQWLPIVDADFGSAAFLPLVDGGTYRVSLAPAGGLVARPADAATEGKLRSLGW